MERDSGHLTIEPANKAQVPLIAQMWQAIDQLGEPRPFGGDSPEKQKKALKMIDHAIESQEACILVALKGDQLIGTIAGHIFQRPGVKLSPIGVIYSLWVNQDCRWQGAGKTLLGALENHLKQAGAKSLQVGWETNNITAKHWWQRQGYLPYEVIAHKSDLESKNSR